MSVLPSEHSPSFHLIHEKRHIRRYKSDMPRIFIVSNTGTSLCFADANPSNLTFSNPEERAAAHAHVAAHLQHFSVLLFPLNISKKYVDWMDYIVIAPSWIVKLTVSKIGQSRMRLYVQALAEIAVAAIWEDSHDIASCAGINQLSRSGQRCPRG